MRYVDTLIETPQSEALIGEDQVQNSAGGYVYEVDKWTMLRRFLILGTEGGSYYATERKLTVANAKNVLACIKEDGVRVVNETVAISDSGRAPKNDPALFVLALVCAFGEASAKSVAYANLSKVARIGTHLFQFVDSVNALRGWGRGLRGAIGGWYNERAPLKLAEQLVKYQQREGWSHRDVLRLAHVNPATADHAALYRYATGKGLGEASEDVRAYIAAVDELAKTTDVRRAVELIQAYTLPREVVPTKLLNNVKVWEALLPHMGMTALIRNLATMTRVGLLEQMGSNTTAVCARLADSEQLRKSRIHPVQVITALYTYKNGRGVRGSNVWTPVPRIIDTLNDAFYASFGNVRPTGKRFVLGLDVSGSMDGGTVAGVPGFTPRVAAATMAMVTARVESEYAVVAFTSGSGGSRMWGGNSGISVLDITPSMRLDTIVRKTQELSFGGTDCALPMLWAGRNKITADAFCVYTDSETWAGSTHPSAALRNYRKERNVPAKLVVVGMVSNNFSIADPKDAGMLDVVGFDTATPNLIADFVGSGF